MIIYPEFHCCFPPNGKELGYSVWLVYFDILGRIHNEATAEPLDMDN